MFSRTGAIIPILTVFLSVLLVGQASAQFANNAVSACHNANERDSCTYQITGTTISGREYRVVSTLVGRD
ncbi:hypothetical protein PM082_002255 [Marasmius tenuissimus]|nr:hypothetical protein PM082_002255 [Marasmius tenuissimus]